MKKLILLPMLIIFAVWFNWAVAADQKEPPKNLTAGESVSRQSEDEKAVRESADKFVDVFNKADAKQMAALWTSDGEYINDRGRILKGRDEIEKKYAAFFSANKGLKIDVSISSIKVSGGQSAIESGTATTKSANGVPLSKGYYTALHVKEGNKWLIAGVREHDASPGERRSLQDLEWLIGDWTASIDAKKLDFNINWIADKTFIQLSYRAEEKGAVSRSGIQVIGRDPESGELVSWSFDSSGGYGRGRWRVLKKGIIIESEAKTTDGLTATSTEIISKIDGKGIAVQSVDRRIGNQSLKDLDKIVLTKKSGKE